LARITQPRAAHLAAIAGIFFLSACAFDPSTIVRTPRVVDTAEARSGEPADESLQDGKPAGESETDLPPEITDAVEKPAQVAAVEIDLTNFKERLLGLDDQEITELLGKPKFERSEPPAKIWQYQSDECFVDLFLFEEAGDLTVDHVEVRGKQVEKTDEKICFASILKAANGGEGKPAPLGPIAPKKSTEQPAPGAVKKPAVQQEAIPEDGGDEIAPPELVPENPESVPDSGPEVPAFGPDEPVEEPDAEPASPKDDGSKKSPPKPAEKPLVKPGPDLEKITGDEEDVPEVEFKMTPVPQDKTPAKPADKSKTKTAPKLEESPEDPPVSVEEPPEGPPEDPTEEPQAEPLAKPETKPETKPQAKTKAEPKPEPEPAADDGLGNDSLDSEKTGDAPGDASDKVVKKPVQDELPDAPKLGQTEGDDDLLEDPAP